MGEGLENCVVLHRELMSLGYEGGYSILKSYVSPRRRRRQLSFFRNYDPVERRIFANYRPG